VFLQVRFCFPGVPGEHIYVYTLIQSVGKETQEGSYACPGQSRNELQDFGASAAGLLGVPFLARERT
jgi:hypothetical protein